MVKKFLKEQPLFKKRCIRRKKIKVEKNSIILKEPPLFKKSIKDFIYINRFSKKSIKEKFINFLMVDGEKSKASKLFSKAALLIQKKLLISKNTGKKLYSLIEKNQIINNDLNEKSYKVNLYSLSDESKLNLIKGFFCKKQCKLDLQITKPIPYNPFSKRKNEVNPLPIEIIYKGKNEINPKNKEKKDIKSMFEEKKKVNPKNKEKKGANALPKEKKEINPLPIELISKEKKEINPPAKGKKGVNPLPKGKNEVNPLPKRKNRFVLKKKNHRVILLYHIRFSVNKSLFYSMNKRKYKKNLITIPLETLLQTSLENIKPTLEVRKVRRAGTTYQVPAIISKKRQETIAIRWLLEAAKMRKRNSPYSFADSIAEELIDAFNKRGVARQKRDELHKIAQSNRAFIRYRWW